MKKENLLEITDAIIIERDDKGSPAVLPTIELLSGQGGLGGSVATGGEDYVRVVQTLGQKDQKAAVSAC